MPYIEAKSPTIKKVFRDKNIQTISRANQMKTGQIYLFTYNGKKITQRRPLMLCTGKKQTKQGKTIVEGINLNYLSEIQGQVFETFDIVFGSVAADDIVTALSKHGDYKNFPLENIYRTYSVERISNIQQIIM